MGAARLRHLIDGDVGMDAGTLRQRLDLDGKPSYAHALTGMPPPFPSPATQHSCLVDLWLHCSVTLQQLCSRRSVSGCNRRWTLKAAGQQEQLVSGAADLSAVRSHTRSGGHHSVAGICVRAAASAACGPADRPATHRRSHRQTSGRSPSGRGSRRDPEPDASCTGGSSVYITLPRPQVASDCRHKTAFLNVQHQVLITCIFWQSTHKARIQSVLLHA